MRLSFNKNTKEVYIEDGAVAGLKMQKIGFGLTFLSQAILLVDLDFDNITILDYASIILIILSLGLFYHYFFRVSVAKNIPVKNIIGLKQKKSFDITNFSFKLKNGKTRTLTDNTEISVATIFPFCKSHNIPVL